MLNSPLRDYIVHLKLYCYDFMQIFWDKQPHDMKTEKHWNLKLQHSKNFFEFSFSSMKLKQAYKIYLRVYSTDTITN